MKKIEKRNEGKMRELTNAELKQVSGGAEKFETGGDNCPDNKNFREAGKSGNCFKQV